MGKAEAPKVGDRLQSTSYPYCWDRPVYEIWRVTEVVADYGQDGYGLRAERTVGDKTEHLSCSTKSECVTLLPWTPDLLIYAAHVRCPCGAGMAYRKDPGPDECYWDCSAILLGKADRNIKHTAQLPFVFYEIKSEEQPSANGATTREQLPGKLCPESNQTERKEK